MNKVMKRVINWQIHHPGTVIGVLLSLTLFFSYHAIGARFDFTIEHLFAQNDPEVDAYFEFREDFGREDNLVYLAYVCSDPFSYDNLETTRELTSEFERIEGIKKVTSLTNVELFSSGSGMGEGSEEIVLSPVFQTIPKDAESLNHQKKRILSTPLLVDNLVSRNGRIAAIVLSIRDEYNKHDDRKRILEEVSIIRETVPWEWHEAGIPVLRTRYVQYMLDDFLRFFAPVLAVLVGVLTLLFRTWRGVFLPLATVLIADTWTIGVMVLMGIDINIISYIVPTLILIIGVADSIHILVKFHEELTHTESKLEAISETIRRIGAAIFLTSVTTAVGFMSLMSTNILVVRQFGLIVGVGVILAFFTSITFIPSVLAILEKPSEARLYRSTHSFRHRFTTWVVRVNNRYQVVIVLSSLLVVVLCLLLATQVDPHSSLMEDLRGRGRLYRDMEFMDREMASTFPLEVVVTRIDARGPVEDGVKQPAFLRQVSSLQQMLSQIPEVGTTLSVADYLREIHQVMHGGNPRFYAIPETEAAVAQYLLLYEEEFDFLMNYDYSRTRIAGRIQDITSRRAQEITGAVLDWSEKNLSEDLDVRLTGTTLMALKTNQYLVKNLVVSFLIAFGVIFFSMWFLFRSAKLASLSMIPNFIPLLMMAGIMGLLHIKLRPTTAMTFAVAFGIAVDDTIHILARFRQELFANPGNYRVASEQTLLTTGKAILSTSVILIAGFLVMVISNFAPSRDFGFLAAVTLVGALVGDLFFLPSVITLIRPRIRSTLSS